jgi:choloylglycine hydrolase
VLDAEKNSCREIDKLENKYGYWGRFVFHTPKVDDAMNTRGLSIAGLYLDGYTQYPEYNPADKRPVLGVFDIINFLISQARNVDEALALIRSHQIIQSSAEIKPGIFLKNAPPSFCLAGQNGQIRRR